MARSSHASIRGPKQIAATLSGRSVIGDKYIVGKMVAHGSMGTIFEAQNTWTKRHVALKVLSSQHSNDQEAVQRFIREARVTGSLDHPNIVQVIDLAIDTSINSFILVMEHLTGVDLRTQLQTQKKFQVREALEIAIPVTHALAAAHRLGVLHRDVKPENIFLSETPLGIVPKLLDFGVAGYTSQVEPKITQAGTTLGSVEYMSPEQASCRPDLDGRSDQWSVGILLFELLVGHSPFYSKHTFEVLESINTYKSINLQTHVTDVSDDVVAIVNRTLRRDRNLRFDTMEDLLRAVFQCKALTEGSSTPYTVSANALEVVNRNSITEATLLDIHAPSAENDNISDDETTLVETNDATESSVVIPGPTKNLSEKILLMSRDGRKRRLAIGIIVSVWLVALYVTYVRHPRTAASSGRSAVSENDHRLPTWAKRMRINEGS
jgi:serine/threonine protein kinase